VSQEKCDLGLARVSYTHAFSKCMTMSLSCGQCMAVYKIRLVVLPAPILHAVSDDQSGKLIAHTQAGAGPALY
jgi:hypothetical protein